MSRDKKNKQDQYPYKFIKEHFRAGSSAVESMLSLVMKEREMVETMEYVVALYVDRATQQWVVRDREGNFWSLPIANEAWENRRPFEPQLENPLEPIPGHYKYLLRLPF